MFHNNDDDDDAIILANLVYSPRACLWEHHMYCAVLSTSMECNICHGCHSQWRCHFGPLPTGLPSAELRLISNRKGAKPLQFTPHSINVSQDLETWRCIYFKHPRFIGPYLSCACWSLLKIKQLDDCKKLKLLHLFNIAGAVLDDNAIIQGYLIIILCFLSLCVSVVRDIEFCPRNTYLIY